MSLRNFLHRLKKIDDCYVRMAEAGKPRLPALFQSRQSDFQRAYELFEGFDCPPKSVIIDVGANRGQFCRLADLRFSPSKILCFEPLPEAFRELKGAFGKHPACVLYPCALGSEPGRSSFEINTHDQASSLLPIRNGGDLSFTHRDLTPTGHMDVEVRTLDEVCGELAIDQVHLLKLDVQGFELEVMKGAETTLSHTATILTEVSFYPQYEGGALYGDIHDFLKERGFYLIGFRDYQTSQKGYALQADAIFCNHNPQ